jgi:chromosome segregation ATPase
MDYVKIDEEEIELYIRETTEERSRDYDEDELREELFDYNSTEWDEFDGAEYDVKSYKEEIKKLSLEIQEKEFKKDNVESELIVLEKDIERLDYYSDDETNYRDMEYSEEIEELQHTYNNYKRIFDELELYLEESYKELDKLQTNLEESKTMLEKYSGESLIDLYVNAITESKVEEALTDIEWFLDYVGMEISEAVEYGYLDIDDDEVIEAAIEADGLGHWLAGYDGYENEEIITIFLRNCFFIFISIVSR